MCCGAKRSLNRNQTNLRAQQQPPSVGSFPGAAGPAQTAPSVQFEYTGKTRLTVISPTTGARYHFESPGARLSVDPRDQSMMIYVPDLRPVRFTRIPKLPATPA